ncbi:MAG TPA: hypothetical protein VG407_18620 [Caulobacteraceae bacterium]|jgi:tetratricopeptide (TPR) repeat protein|nr:hypothetical protein [Caulobacteraceae bacterium]
MSEKHEEPEVEAEEVLEQANPVAVALALGRKRRAPKADTGADPKVDAFLDEQTRLLRLQSEHLHEQRDLQLAHLRVRRWKDRLSISLQGLTVLVGVLVLGVVAALAVDAANYRGLEVEAFYTPPGFAASGMDGRTLAARVTDRLSDMDAHSESFRARASYETNWNGDIKIEVPETGVSIGEFRHYLREWLGHPTRITGEASRVTQGISLTVRADNAPGFVISGPEADVDKLVQQAAEKLFGATQPYQYSKWLEHQGRTDEALAVARDLAVNGSRQEQAWAWAQVSNLLGLRGDFAGAVAGAKRALEYDPHLVIGWANLAFNEAALGHEDDALTHMIIGQSHLEHASPREIEPRSRRLTLPYNAAMLYSMAGGWRDAAAKWNEVAGLPDFQSSESGARMFYADALARDHDASASRAARLALSHPDVDASVDFFDDFRENEKDAAPEYFEAAEVGDWNAALDIETRAIATSLTQGPLGLNIRERFLLPRLAYAQARLGDFAAANATIAQTPSDCDLCLRTRARIAGLERNWATADALFAQAVGRAPSIPTALVDWAQVLLARGDAADAARKAQFATLASSHNPDANEIWGEALLAQHDASAAAGKLAAASKDAPRWGRNHLMWAHALLQTGDRAGARLQLLSARGMDLSPGDRSQVEQMLMTAR